jgi:hypothetical protein
LPFLGVDLETVVIEDGGRMRPATTKGGASVRIERRIAASVAVGGSLLLALSAAAPAVAGGHSAVLARASGVRLAITANKSSTLFGGWTFAPKAAKSVTSEFKIPALKCSGTVTSGLGPIAVMITGTTSSQNFNAAGLLLECNAGSPAAATAVVVNGTATVGTSPVAVGDVIQATVTTSATKTTATVADLTHKSKLTKSGTGAAALQEEVIDDSLVNTGTGKQLPVANFGKLAFVKAAVSGKAIGTVIPRVAFNMVNKAKVLQILTGKITGTAKNAFLTTWKHS